MKDVSLLVCAFFLKIDSSHILLILDRQNYLLITHSENMFLITEFHAVLTMSLFTFNIIIIMCLKPSCTFCADGEKIMISYTEIVAKRFTT